MEVVPTVNATATATPPPYDPLLPAPPTQPISRPTPTNQVTRNDRPVSMDTPTETPHDLFCLAKEYDRRGRSADAANLYLKASMNGHLSAMVSYAAHLVATDERAAFVWFRAAAERGDARAWAELGQLLARGRYFEVNAIDAARCWKRAAQMGDNSGKSALGLCYIRGFGVKQDPEKGVEIVRQVADVYNDVTAMKNLAWIYRHGKGVAKNLDEAEFWDARAKKQDKLMSHITTREHVLFGRGRFSRHSKHTKTSNPPVTTTVEDQLPRTRHLKPPSRPPQLREEDIKRRLRGISEDPTRRSPSTSQVESKNRTQFSSNQIQTPHPPAHPPTTSRAPLSKASNDDSHAQNSPPSPPPHRPPHPVTVPAAIAAGSVAAQNPPVSTPDPDIIPAEPASDVDAALNDFNPATDRAAHPTADELQFPQPDSIPVESGFVSPVEELPATQSARDIHADTLQATPVTELPVDNRASTEPVAVSTSRGAIGVTTTVPAEKDSPPEQYITPEQSLEEEGENSSDLLEPVLADDHGCDEDTVSSEPHPDPDDAIQADITSPNISDLPPTDEQVHSPDIQPGPSSPPEHLPTAQIGSPSHPLAPSIRTRTEAFERRMGGAGQPTGSPQPQIHRGNSYAVPKTSGEDRDGLGDFEDTDLIRVSSGGPPRGIGYDIGAVRSKLAGASAPVAEKQLADVPRSYGASSDGGYGGDLPTHDGLREILAVFPENPMRADSQVRLFNLLNTIQRFPISDTEAFSIVEQSNGFSKIVVAMLSQHEDEFIQEQGLHSLVRIIRSTPSAQRETMVLSPYADCYRNAQGDPDAVVPKGPLSIDERSCGAIQAIIQAMRHHQSVRRVQLAGCAALGEVAAASPSCRSIAYEHGAVDLIVACLHHRSSQAACTIHDIASRAITTFCAGKDNFPFKEAFARSDAVAELLSVLQLWGHSEDITSELLTTATKNCCMALRHISDGCKMASTQCVQSFAYHHLVRTLVLRRNDVSVCTIVVSAMAAITRGAGSIAEKGLQDAKPLPEVLITMQVHSEHPLFTRKCLDFMEALGNFGSLKEEIVLAGGIPFATDIIQQGGTDSLLLERACGVIDKLCRSNAKNQDIFSSNNGIRSLVALLGTHQSLPGVVERALLALTNACANNSKTQKEAVKVGAPDQVMCALSTYSSKNSKVVAAAASAMAAMVVPRNAAVAQSFAKLKAPELVVRAMKRHPDSVLVEENGSAAIASFCEADPHIISTLLKSGISSILVVALQRFLHKQTAVVQIVRAMRALSNEASEDSYRFKSKLLTDRSNESGLSEIFHTALSFHKKGLPETANVIISICATINRLCMRSVAFKNEVGKDGIVEELKRLVEKTSEYKDLGALQPVLATICTLVLDSEDNKNRFHASGGVEAILDVMQKWKTDTYVLEHCCAALRYSCNDHYGNCDEVKNHNGVRSILGVMELHPENVNVTLWCCLTLADLCKGDEELQSSPNVFQGIRKVVSAMSTFSSNSRFLASACEFLRAASFQNVENQERIVRLGGRTAIVKAMEAHPQDQSLTESGAYALLQVQDVQDARSSVDSQPQLGLVKRLSRDLRRSESGSNRSNRSSAKGGRLGRKSRSFSTKKKPTTEETGASDQQVPNQVASPKTPAPPPSRPSLINFSRGARSRIRKSKTAPVALPVEEVEDEEARATEVVEERYQEGANDGYGEFNPPAAEERESDSQID